MHVRLLGLILPRRILLKIKDTDRSKYYKQRIEEFQSREAQNVALVCTMRERKRCHVKTNIFITFALLTMLTQLVWMFFFHDVFRQTLGLVISRCSLAKDGKEINQNASVEARFLLHLLHFLN